jgi:hypothetical protein
MPLGPSAWLCYKENMQTDTGNVRSVWGDYPNWDDVARFVYGRRMWRLPDMRAHLLAHWPDQRHPHRERFQQHRDLIEAVLASEEPAEGLDAALRHRRTSLRCVAREIPPVFGDFFV